MRRKLYELAQLWVDPDHDAVRDVLRAIQLHLHDQARWKHDYDGLFHARNHTFAQLIHILDISKYDCRPHEVWVAKPWSMSAKAAVSHAGTLLRSLKDRGIIQQSPGRPGESVLVLSKEARKRIYVPDGILRHRHACQYLSFCPPFEPLSGSSSSSSSQPPTSLLRVDVLGADSEDGCSQLSDSHCLSLGSVAEHPSGNNDRTALLHRPRSSAPQRHPALSSAMSTASSSSRPLHAPIRSTTMKNSSHHNPSRNDGGEPPSKARRRRSNTNSHNTQHHNGGNVGSSNVGFVQALGALKCASCKRDHDDDEAPRDAASSVGPTWRAAWDETSASALSGPTQHRVGATTTTTVPSAAASVAPSVVSESAPLLRTGKRATTAGWRYEI